MFRVHGIFPPIRYDPETRTAKVLAGPPDTSPPLMHRHFRGIICGVTENPAYVFRVKPTIRVNAVTLAVVKPEIVYG